MNISEKIKDVIKKEGVKIIDLAKKMNTSQSNISNILSKDDMRVSTLEKIAAALNVSVAIFYQEDTDLDSIIEKKIEEALSRRANQEKSE